GRGAGGQGVHELLVLGVAVADDQRGARDNGGGGDALDRRLRGGLGGAVGGGGIRRGILVVAGRGAGGDRGAGHVHQPRARRGRGQGDVRAAVRGGGPVRLLVRGVNDRGRPGPPGQRDDVLPAPDVDPAPVHVHPRRNAPV